MWLRISFGKAAMPRRSLKRGHLILYADDFVKKKWPRAFCDNKSKKRYVVHD